MEDFCLTCGGFFDVAVFFFVLKNGIIFDFDLYGPGRKENKYGFRLIVLSWDTSH